IPEFLAVVKVERNHCTGILRCLHPFDNHFGGGWRERRKNTAAVEPSHATAKNDVPVEIASLQATCRFVRAIVKDDGPADAKASVAVNGGHVRAADTIMREPLVERFHPHGS